MLGRAIVICVRTYVSVCVCVRACVRACVRGWVRACVRAYVYYHNNNKQMAMNDI